MTATKPISRALTARETDLARSIFGDAIAYQQVQVNRRRWFPFQPVDVVMAPDGQLWFHPLSQQWRDCFGCAELSAQGLFIHELTHVWQAQRHGRWWLPIVRHPFCRYSYQLDPGKPLPAYGIEQQAEIVRHLFLARNGICVPGAASRQELEAVVQF
jgi:hypothetical protein